MNKNINTNTNTNTNKGTFYDRCVKQGKTFGPFIAESIHSRINSGGLKYICRCAECGTRRVLSTYQLVTGTNATCYTCGASVTDPICEPPKFGGKTQTLEGLNLKLLKERADALVATGKDPCGTYPWCAYCKKGESSACARAKYRMDANKRHQSCPSQYSIGDKIGNIVVVEIRNGMYFCRCEDCKGIKKYSLDEIAEGKCTSAHHDRDMKYIGKRFGALVVKERVRQWKHKGVGTYWYTMYRCVCDCGREVTLNNKALDSATATLNCGSPKCTAKPKHNVGDKVGKLEVVEIRNGKYFCRCEDCRTVKPYTAFEVANGECTFAHHDKDLEYLDKRFGTLTVKERVLKWRGSGNRKYATFRCICDCGKELLVTSTTLDGTSEVDKTCGWSKCIAKALGADKCDTDVYSASVKEKLQLAAQRQAVDGKPYYAMEVAKAINYFNNSNWLSNTADLSHNSSTGVTGVAQHNSGTYVASICWRGTKITLGQFLTLDAATLVRAEAEIYLRHATELELAKIYGGPQVSLEQKLALIGLNENTRAIDLVRANNI